MNYQIHCQNRNQFYIGLNNNGVTLWSSNREEAKKFDTKLNANRGVKWLKENIIDNKYIRVVSVKQKIY